MGGVGGGGGERINRRAREKEGGREGDKKREVRGKL